MVMVPNKSSEWYAGIEPHALSVGSTYLSIKPVSDKSHCDGQANPTMSYFYVTENM